MDMEQLMTPIPSMKGDGASLSKCRSISSTINESEDNSAAAGFDCNICLDSVQDPVVTLCGHLYCWPCIYKWIHYQTTDETLAHHQPQCPVCKAKVSQGTLIPLYGRGATAKPSDGKSPNLGLTVPKRPPSMMACGFRANAEASTSPSPSPSPLHYRGYSPRSQQYRPHPVPTFSLGGTNGADLIHPMSGMIGEMVYARVFGNSTMDSYGYGYPESYHVVGNGNPRLRRHLMQTDQSLGRVCFFLFCCVVLCLLLF